jgi:CDGSH-type Zn-finger protein
MTEVPTFPRPTTYECPGGPLLVRGDHVVTEPDGTEHRTTRPVSAVCRCGHSASPPWCDGTHKVARREKPGATTPQVRPA